MSLLFKVILIFFAALLILTGIQLFKIYRCIKKGNVDIKPWQHIKKDATFKVLFAGDSTAVGTGLLDNTSSTSALFSRDYPDFDLENYSQNGLRLRGLAHILEGLQDKRFNLAVFQIGANDIIFATPFQQIRKDQAQVLSLARHIAKRIIILHSGDIGESPLFIWPFSWIYTWRSLKLRELYMANQDERVSYLDIYTLNKGKDYSDCYGRDDLHLNAKGYALWYSFIKNQLNQLHWLPVVSRIGLR